VTKLITNNKKVRRKLLSVNFPIKRKKTNDQEIIIKGKNLINLSTNDYLGLSKHKSIIKESIKWTKLYGNSLSSSRLITGNFEKLVDLEKMLSLNVKHEKTLVLGNGFLLNSTVIPAITGNTIGNKSKFYIFSDKLNHASINYGNLLTNQKIYRYNHLDLEHLESLLKKVEKKSNKMIVSETLFSMDGDFVDLEGIRFLSKKYNCILYLDDAHSFGVYGENGFGFATKGQKLEKEIVVGTFSKAVGSYGAFISCSKFFYDLLVDKCPGLIYSTALPPSVIGAVSESLKLFPKINKLRKQLIDNSIFIINRLNKFGFNTGNSSSYIIPVILGKFEACEVIKKTLEKNNFYIKSTRHPTVPKNFARLRMSLTALTTKDTIKNFLNVMAAFKLSK